MSRYTIHKLTPTQEIDLSKLENYTYTETRSSCCLCFPRFWAKGSRSVTHPAVYLYPRDTFKFDDQRTPVTVAIAVTQHTVKCQYSQKVALGLISGQWYVLCRNDQKRTPIAIATDHNALIRLARSLTGQAVLPEAAPGASTPLLT